MVGLEYSCAVVSWQLIQGRQENDTAAFSPNRLILLDTQWKLAWTGKRHCSRYPLSWNWFAAYSLKMSQEVTEDKKDQLNQKLSWLCEIVWLNRTIHTWKRVYKWKDKDEHPWTLHYAKNAATVNNIQNNLVLKIYTWFAFHMPTARTKREITRVAPWRDGGCTLIDIRENYESLSANLEEDDSFSLVREDAQTRALFAPFWKFLVLLESWILLHNLFMSTTCSTFSNSRLDSWRILKFRGQTCETQKDLKRR